MNEPGVTYLCDVIAQAGPELPANSQLPMYLIMVSGGIPGAMLRLSADGTRLGRAADNTFPLSEATVSRHHARFGVDPQGIVRLIDLASTNGTFLNGRRLVPHTPSRIQD